MEALPPAQILLVEKSLYPCDAKVGRGATTSLHIFDSDVAVCSRGISPEEAQIVPL